MYVVRDMSQLSVSFLTVPNVESQHLRFIPRDTFYRVLEQGRPRGVPRVQSHFFGDRSSRAEGKDNDDAKEEECIDIKMYQTSEEKDIYIKFGLYSVYYIFVPINWYKNVINTSNVFDLSIKVNLINSTILN